MFGKIIPLIIACLLILSINAPANAQAKIELERLSIEIWPEFDRPSTLVIYRGSLAESVPLPALVQFHLPKYLSELNAAASFDTENRLINAPYQLEQTANDESVTLN
ncbi:MAG: hypothetical protein AAF629_28150, partial [Chloroflexota bacterium]